jgi:putative phage-type endonuclease
MKIVKLKQNTTEWLKWREGKVTASVAGAVMGQNPYESALDAYKRIKGLSAPVAMNDAIRQGNALEPRARQRFEMLRQESFPELCGESETYPYLAASFDGFNLRSNLSLEIKCPTEGVWNRIREEGLSAIPYYVVQVHQQLLVSEAKKGFLFIYRERESWNPADVVDNTEIVRVTDWKTGANVWRLAEWMTFEIFRNENYLQNRLLPALKDFHECLITDTPPLAGEGEVDPQVVLDSRWEKIAQEWIKVKARIAEEGKSLDALKKTQKFLEKEMSLIHDDLDTPCSVGSGVRCSSFFREGTVDWARFAKDHVENFHDDMLAPYRKAPTKQYRFSAINVAKVLSLYGFSSGERQKRRKKAV